VIAVTAGQTDARDCAMSPSPVYAPVINERERRPCMQRIW
jgi:hypothetical protein